MRTPAHRQALFADVLVGALSAAGVRDVVLSPGSRSTPFVFALLRHPGFRVHDVIDERVAGFVALGVGRATGRPALLLCTSGSAPAHYYPAVIEASAAQIPLLVLSADRPIEAHGAGANQTIDQQRLFGVHARFFADVGGPTEDESALRALARTAVQAVRACLDPTPGPAHINARAVKPLEPPSALDADARAADEALLARLGRPPVFHVAERVPSEAALDALEAMVRGGRGVVLAGPCAAYAGAQRAVERLARAAGAPLLAEAASQLRFGAAADAPVVTSIDALGRSSLTEGALAPDYILALGAAPVTRGGLRYVERHRGPLAVVAEHGYHDPDSRAAHVVEAPIAAVANALAARLEARPVGDRASWMARHAEADAAIARVADAVLEAEPALSEAAVARAVVDALPAGAYLAVGNSLPIRHLESFGGRRAAPLRLLTQRGASGIDGLVSAAAGAALATGEPCALLIGDVSLLHDAGGLAIAAASKAPLTIVVIANGGGRIFEQLPVGTAPAPALAHFVTPHEVRLDALAAAYGVVHRRVEDLDALRAALASPPVSGAVLIEAVVPPRGAAALARRFFEATEEALAALAPRLTRAGA